MTSSLRRRRKLFANHRPSTLITACIYLVAAALTTAETSGNAAENEDFYRCIPGMESSGGESFFPLLNENTDSFPHKNTNLGNTR